MASNFIELFSRKDCKFRVTTNSNRQSLSTKRSWIQGKHFFSTHINGIRYTREWLVYSQSSDSIYCIFCAIFNRNKNALSAFGRGYSECKNIIRDVAAHENSFKHHSAFKSWLELSKHLKTNQTIDTFQIKLLDK